jgi:hypothetical protein
MKFEDFLAMEVWTVFPWTIMPCSFVRGANISEEWITTIVRVYTKKLLSPKRIYGIITPKTTFHEGLSLTGVEDRRGHTI